MAMNRPFRLLTPDRLQIQEGGGCLSVFGIPFFGAGIFLFLILLGVVPLSNADVMPWWGSPALVLMAIAFTAVGGGLVFGRSWTTIDRAQREVIRQSGLLVALRQRRIPMAGVTAVTLGFIQGDSDSADRFPLALKARNGPDLQLCSFTEYAKARECARAVAEHLRIEIEDASTDHAITLTPGQIELPLRQRARQDEMASDAVARPPDARSEVTRHLDEVRIVIPFRRQNPLVLATTLIPIGILLAFGPSLATFFRESNTPRVVGWAFLGFLGLFFGLLPLMTIVGAFVRSRRGATIVEVSKHRLRILERGAWKTHTIMSADAEDILDVDYSSRESSLASARRAAEQQVVQAYPSAVATVTSRVERIVTRLSHYAKGKGVTIKTRTGLTAFGEGLEDAEVRYLFSLVRRTMTE